MLLPVVFGLVIPDGPRRRLWEALRCVRGARQATGALLDLLSGLSSAGFATWSPAGVGGALRPRGSRPLLGCRGDGWTTRHDGSLPGPQLGAPQLTSGPGCLRLTAAHEAIPGPLPKLGRPPGLTCRDGGLQRPSGSGASEAAALGSARAPVPDGRFPSPGL